MANQIKNQQFVDTMLSRGEDPSRIKSFLASAGQSLDGLVFEKKEALSANLGTANKVAESVGRTLAPKSVEGFGETLGTMAAVNEGTTDAINQSSVASADATFRLARLMNQTTDPVKKAQLRAQIEASRGAQPGSASEQIRGVNKSAKTVASEAIGTAGTMALGAQAPGGVVGRLAMGTAVGAGTAAKDALAQDMSAGDIASRTVKGGVVGLATTAAIEGAFAAVKGIYHWVVPPGDTMNRELRVPKQKITASIERGYKTLGEKIVDVTDDAGNKVYHGNPRDILDQAKGELSEKGDALTGLLKSHKDVQLTRKELTDRVLGELTDEFSVLDSKERQRALYEIAHATGGRQVFNPEVATGIKRAVDDTLPDNMWKIIAEGDRPRAFVVKTKYLIRDGLRQMINESTDDATIQALNNRLSLAMDVRHLAAARIAEDMLRGAPGHIIDAAKQGAVYLAHSAGLQSLFAHLARGAEQLVANKAVSALGKERE